MCVRVCVCVVIVVVVVVVVVIVEVPAVVVVVVVAGVIIVLALNVTQEPIQCNRKLHTRHISYLEETSTQRVSLPLPSGL